MILQIHQSPIFERYVKKQAKQFKEKLDQEVKRIAKNPTIGEQKKGDLSHVWVHKFKFQGIQILMAYINDEKQIKLVMVGPHENYYRDLKNYTKSSL